MLDTKGYGDVLNRSWTFRSVGYGNDLVYWKDIISNLRLVGYTMQSPLSTRTLFMARTKVSKAVATLKEQ